MDVVDQTCPRCQAEVQERFYGPCTSCRDQLRAKYEGLARQIDSEGYVPKMNVVANQVATKE